MAQITETGTIDLKAQKAGHDDAATKATNYIAADSTGIRIANANPSTATTYQHQTATETEFVVNGESMLKVGGDGQRIGKEYVQGATDNESHMELDYHSMQMVDKDGTTYFHVSDLRGTDGVAEIVDTFVGDGTTRTFYLSLVASDTDYTVSVSDSSGGTVTKSTNMVMFQSAPTVGATITVTYDSESPYAKAYTLGLRRSSGNIGGYSLVEGRDNIASGSASHAEGRKSKASGQCSHAEGGNTTASGGYSHAEGDFATASGNYSHAEGYSTTASKSSAHAEGHNTEASGRYSHAQNNNTIAASGNQTVIGKFNVSDANDAYALIIGNGTDANTRSNAAVIDWLGNYIAQGWAGITQMFAGAVTQTVDSDGVATATGAPAGWLLCDGSAVSRTEYATLYAAIGDTWGAGDGSTTFNLPDLRGRAPIGAGAGSGLTARTLGGTGGSENAIIPYHRHAMGAHTHAHPGEPYLANSETVARRTVSSGSGATNQLYSSGATGRYNNTGAMNGTPYTGYAGTSGNTDNANMQPYAVVNYIIHTGKTS